MDENKEVILTPEGFKKLQEEFNNLETTKRREVAARLKQAIEFGDLSENSEYDDAKNEQAFIEARISQLKSILSNATFIDDKKASTQEVSIGSKVNLRDMQTKEILSYLVVGFAEADPANHKISNESPVGKAILGKKASDVVEVETPEGSLKYKITSITRNSIGQKQKNIAK